MNDQAQALRERAAREKAEALQERAAAIQSRLLANESIREEERKHGGQTRHNRRKEPVTESVV